MLPFLLFVLVSVHTVFGSDCIYESFIDAVVNVLWSFSDDSVPNLDMEY